MHLDRTARKVAAEDLSCEEPVRVERHYRWKAEDGTPIIKTVACEQEVYYVCRDRCPDGCRLDENCEQLCQVRCERVPAPTP